MDRTPGHPEEIRLKREYTVAEKVFRGPGMDLRLLLPTAPDDLIDVSDFNADERLPYWAELWPSAAALSEWLMRRPPAEPRALEIGCGLGLPSLALRMAGVEVLATDYYADALRFARVNALRNGISPPETRLADWRDEWGGGRYPLVLASDLLYERRNAAALLELLPQVLASGGRVLLADPGRSYLSAFLSEAAARDWRARDLAEISAGSGGAIRIIQLDRTGERRTVPAE